MMALAVQVATVLGQSGSDTAAHKVSTILVVDDEPDIRTAVRNLLERALKHVHVITAADGFEGLKILRQQSIDLIVTDFKMPGMNGFEFIREAMKVSPSTPRILITAFERELALDANAEGAFTHIFTKPLDPRPLVKTCQRMLGETA